MPSLLVAQLILLGWANVIKQHMTYFSFSYNSKGINFIHILSSYHYNAPFQLIYHTLLNFGMETLLARGFPMQ